MSSLLQYVRHARLWICNAASLMVLLYSVACSIQAGARSQSRRGQGQRCALPCWLRVIWFLAFPYLGNAALNSGDHKKAAEFYREALKLSSDGPSSHIYHSNLAAALTYLGKYDEVIDHCEQSIALKPSYVKAYSRMGSAHLHLKDYDAAVDAFRHGLEIDSFNAACRDGLAEAERKLSQRQSVANASNAGPGAGAAAGGMPDLSGLASMLGGGGGGLADLMSNPAMQQMASSMMQNPAMMQMYVDLCLAGVRACSSADLCWIQGPEHDEQP